MSSNPTTDDSSLIRRCQEGDPQAFRVLVERHHPRIFALIHGLVKDRDEADDLAQEVFIKAYRSLSGFERRSQIYTWLYRIAVNRALDWLKTRGRRPETPMANLADTREEVLLRGPGETDSDTMRHELGQALETALEGIPGEYRLALTLREEQGLSYEEMAASMGCSVGTVKSRLFRARMLLQKALADVHEDWKGA
jgi:RNA polymerase sigma-70 factor (ECF subfamily)